MFKNLKWLRLLPDRPGRGGYKAGFHSFQAQPINDTRVVYGFHVWRGRWRKDFLAATVPGVRFDSGVFAQGSCHGYVYPDTTNPAGAPGITFLSHHIGGGESRYWDYTNNTTRDTHDPNSIAATWLNIDGRCFVADGAREGLILDDRTPAIHAQNNQTLGIAPPTQALQLDVTWGANSPNLAYVGACYIHDASPYVNTPNPDSPIGTILGGGGGDTVTPQVLNPSDPYYAGVTPMPAAIPAANAVSSNVTPFTVAGTLSCTSGTSIVTLSGGTWPANNQYAGLAVNFNGYSFVISTTGPSILDYDIDGDAVHGTGTLLNTEAVILGVYDGPTVTNVPYTITGCQVTMGANATVALGQSPAPTLGYSQSTRSLLAQVGVTALNLGNPRNLGNLSFGNAGGGTTWEGPQYAYAFYDPETGHLSDISPIRRVPAPSTAIGHYENMTPYFRIDPGYISYPSGVDATRFSHIWFFRTLSAPGSATLFPIGSPQPFVGKVHPGSASTRGSWNPGPLPAPNTGWFGIPTTYVEMPPTAGASPNFWFDFSTDADLLIADGIRAPQNTNSKPMVAVGGGLQQPAKIAHMAYWDGRLWTVATQRPGIVAYSCDEAQCPLGVPVESFPPTNILAIPSVDGSVTGMRTFGDMLLITTEKLAYTVAGNNESNYRLVKVSASMPGVGTHQMDEMASDMEGQPSTIFYIARDKMVYQWMPGGRPTPISPPIQDLFDSGIANTVASYRACRLHCAALRGRRVVAVLTDPAQTTSLTANPLLYDVDNQVWTSNPINSVISVSPTNFCTVNGGSPPVNELIEFRTTPDGLTLNSWLRDDTGFNTNVTPFIETFPLDFEGTKKRRQILMVNLHVSNGTASDWTVSILANEDGGHTGISGLYPDPAYSIYTPSFAPIDRSTALDLVVLTAGFNANNAAVVGYRFVIRVTYTGTASPQELYALDIGYTDWEEPAEGDV